MSIPIIDESELEVVASAIWRQFRQNYATGPTGKEYQLPTWKQCAPLAKLNTRSYARNAIIALDEYRALAKSPCPKP